MPYRKGSQSRAPSNPLSRERAKELRSITTLPERLLWSRLRAHKTGFHFRRQHAMGPYVVDFCCNEALLVVETDGYCHTGNFEYDQRRTAWLSECGFEVIRFQATDVMRNLDGVALTVQERAQARVEMLSRSSKKAPSGLGCASATSPAQNGGGGE